MTRFQYNIDDVLVYVEVFQMALIRLKRMMTGKVVKEINERLLQFIIKCRSREREKRRRREILPYTFVIDRLCNMNHF